MTSFWDNEERAREWPIEELSAWAAAVTDRVEQAGGNGVSAYHSLFDLADILGMWEEDSTRRPGQVWGEAALQAMRRRFAHLLDPMREAFDLVPEHPGWITLQLVDLLNPSAGLPRLSEREIERRIRYLKLRATAERMTVCQFDADIAALDAGNEGPDSRRPQTADDSVAELMDVEHVRSRTLQEIAADLLEEAARAYLPEVAAEELPWAATWIREGEIDAASAVLERVQRILYREMERLGNFKMPLLD